MTTPPYLRKGDRIAIVSPARKITPSEVEPAVKTFESWGLEVVIGENAFESFHQFAGTDDQRLEDLQRVLDDDSIRAVICSRGGYGTLRIIDRLNFSHFAKNSKWIIGYSDITVLHSHIQRNFGIETLHAVMPVNFTGDPQNDPSVTSLKKAIFGDQLSYNIGPETLNRNGRCNGSITGGNLSLIYALQGSSSDVDTTAKILFLEDLDEYLYHIDRMMISLKRAGKLDRIAGLIVGGMNRMRDNEVPFGSDANEIIAEAVKGYDYPVCFGFPAGHMPDNMTLIMGREATLEVGDEVRLSF